MKRNLSLWLLLIALTVAALACAVEAPAYTPNPPQMTAGALNGTYEAQASETAQPSLSSTPGPSRTPTPTVTPGPSPTSSIVEVATTPCPATAICEALPPVMATFAPPGEIEIEAGYYTSRDGQRVRDCASLVGCAVKMQLSAGFRAETMGIVGDIDGSKWVCLVVSVDTNGAQLCELAAMWLRADGYKYGSYIKVSQ